MAAVPSDPQSPTPMWQFQALVERVGRVADRVEKNSERLSEREKVSAGDLVEIRELRSDVNRLETTLNKLVWAVVGMALTIAASTIALAIASAGGGH